MPVMMRDHDAGAVAGKSQGVAGEIGGDVLHFFLQRIHIDVAQDGQLLHAGKELRPALGQFLDELAQVFECGTQRKAKEERRGCHR